MIIRKIISGGQTGADQGALDAAIEAGIPHGGWIPKGRLTEGGMLPNKYQLQEMPTASYTRRTVQNIINSDGTVIISHGKLSGGSAYTRKMALKHGRPWIHIDLKVTNPFKAASVLTQWVEQHDIQVLNVAGPRASEDPSIYEHVKKIITGTILLLTAHKEMSTYTQEVPGQDPTDWPKTVDAAVDLLIERMALKDRAIVANMQRDELINLHPNIGLYIWNTFGLGTRENDALIASCCAAEGVREIHEDSASMVIVEALWESLKETHRLRVV